jgi:hypothetical protein
MEDEVELETRTGEVKKRARVSRACDKCVHVPGLRLWRIANTNPFEAAQSTKRSATERILVLDARADDFPALTRSPVSQPARIQPA